MLEKFNFKTSLCPAYSMSLSSAGSMYRPDPDQDEVFSSVVFPALPLHLSPLYTATRWGDLLSLVILVQ